MQRRPFTKESDVFSQKHREAFTGRKTQEAPWALKISKHLVSFSLPSSPSGLHRPLGARPPRLQLRLLEFWTRRPLSPPGWLLGRVPSPFPFWSLQPGSVPLRCSKQRGDRCSGECIPPTAELSCWSRGRRRRHAHRRQQGALGSGIIRAYSVPLQAVFIALGCKLIGYSFLPQFVFP